MEIGNSNTQLPNSKKCDRIFAITGMPRSGTTYLAAILHNPPVVTISEARGQWKQLMKAVGRATRVFDIFSDYRERILRGKKFIPWRGPRLGGRAAGRYLARLPIPATRKLLQGKSRKAEEK